jgi:GNAT superfamily N-acetyltransferase
MRPVIVAQYPEKKGAGGPPSAVSPVEHPMTDPSAVRFEARALRGLSLAEFRRLRTLTQGGRESHLLTLLKERPVHARCYMAWAGDEIVGWSAVRWFAPFTDAPRNAHVSVFVDPDWRRRGLGRRLLDQAVEFALAHRLRPWVYAGHEDQSAFFRACASPAGVVATPFPIR